MQNQKIIRGMCKEAILECITTEDIRKQFQALMKIIENPETTSKDKITAISLCWSYVIPKAKPEEDIDEATKMMRG